MVEEANRVQAESEKAARKRGERHCYSDQLVSQAEGPLQRFVVSHKHSRQSRFPLVRRALKDRKTAVAVDIACVKDCLFEGRIDEALDEIPLDMHPSFVF